MPSAVVASLVASVALGFVELLGRLYPSREAWVRLRRTRGPEAVRAMRERFERAGERRPPKLVRTLLVALVIAWVAAAPLLDKRWYEVALDVSPYVIVYAALWRVPPALRQVAERMKDRERDAGDDPDGDDGRGFGDGGPTALAL
jgi:hypothetical protein